MLHKDSPRAASLCHQLSAEELWPCHLHCLCRGGSEGAGSRAGTWVSFAMGVTPECSIPRGLVALMSDSVKGLALGCLMDALASRPGGSPVLVSMFPCSQEASPFLLRAQIHKEVRSSPKMQLGINTLTARKQIPASWGHGLLRTLLAGWSGARRGASGGTTTISPKLCIAAE